MMRSDEFRTALADVSSIITKYYETVKYRHILPPVKVGFLDQYVSMTPPEDPSNYHDILRDLENHIIPNLTHWAHPHFYGYFPVGLGYPSVLAEILITGLGTIGYSWASNPALTELEYLTCDMYGRLINLPNYLLYDESKHEGGGFLQNSASEGVYNCMLAARSNRLKLIQKDNEPLMKNLDKLVAYSSEQAHSCTEKAAMLLLVKFRLIEVDEHDAMTANALESVIQEDLRSGLVPFFVVASLGTTGTGAIDDFSGIAHLREVHNFWLHIDGAYGGPALMLPEFPYNLNNINIDSFGTNPYKWLLTGLDGSCLWVKSRKLFQSVFEFDSKYYNDLPKTDIDLCNHGLSFTRRMRSLRLWFTLRWYGKDRLINFIRNHMNLANRLKSHIINNSDFILANKVHFGLVCFRVKPRSHFSGEQLTKELLLRLNVSGRIFMIPSKIRGHMILRVSINYEFATEKLIDEAWNIITTTAQELFKKPVFHEAPEQYTFMQKPPTAKQRTIETVSVSNIDFQSIVLDEEMTQNWQKELPFDQLKLSMADIHIPGEYFVDGDRKDYL